MFRQNDGKGPSDAASANISGSRADGLPLAARLAAMRDFLEGQKALDPFIHIFDDGNPIADAMIVASATSRRHAQGLAEGLLRLCPDIGQQFLRMEGYDKGSWILLDCNDVIAHIFLADARAMYRLEDLCGRPVASKKEIIS